MGQRTPFIIDDPQFGKLRLDDLSEEEIDDMYADAEEWAAQAARRARAAKAACSITDEPLATACATLASIASEAAKCALRAFDAVEDGDKDRVRDLIGEFYGRARKAAVWVDAVDLDEHLRVRDKHLRKAREKAARVCGRGVEELMLAEHRCSHGLPKIDAEIPAIDCLLSVKDFNLLARVCVEAILALASPEDEGYSRGVLKLA